MDVSKLPLEIEEWAQQQLLQSDEYRRVMYDDGQPLFVACGVDAQGRPRWCDAVTVGAPTESKPGVHKLQLLHDGGGGDGGGGAGSGGEVVEQTLTAWNHAPRLLPVTTFEELRRR